MAINLLDMLRQAVGDELVNQSSGFLDQSTEKIESALSFIFPALLGGLVDKADEETGALSILDFVKNQHIDGSMLDNLSGQFDSGGAVDELVSSGSLMLDFIFGSGTGKIDTLSDVVSNQVEIDKNTVETVMQMAAPLVLAIMGRRVKEEALDATAIQELLKEQKTDLLAVAPAGLFEKLGFSTLIPTPKPEALPQEPMPDEEEPEPPKASSTLMSRLGPWLLLASIAMALLYIMRSCGGRPSEEKITQEIQTPEETGEKAAPESQISTLIDKTDTTDLTGATIRKVANGVAYITLPDGKDISTSAGSFLDKIYTFLSSENKDADNRFTFENLTFQPDTTLLAPSSTPQMQNLATLLKAYPTVLLHIQAYTGGGDDPAINKTWSEESAASVKTALSVLGVSNDRITTQGNALTSGGDTPSDGVRNRDQRIDLFLKK